jgi:hypothetical protein
MSDKSGGNAYHDPIMISVYCRHIKEQNHSQNAIMKPNQEKKNTLPYMLIGLSAGIEVAFLLMGFTNGAFHSIVMSIMFEDLDV